MIGHGECAPALAVTRALVTGANGFIGSNLCRHLVRRGDEVVGLVRPGSDRTFLGDRSLKIVLGDIASGDGLAEAMCGVSVVYNTAGLASDWGAWSDFWRANVNGVRNVLAAARANNVRRVVHVSSVSVYGFPGGRELDETSPFLARPHDHYITSKAAGDLLALQDHGSDLQISVVRPAGVYGPNDRVTTRPLADALRRGRFVLVDRGQHIMAPLYVGNLVELIRLAGEHERAAGQAFNAIDDLHTTWRQFIEWFCEDLGCPAPRLSLPAGAAWPIAVTIEKCAKAAGLRSSPPVNSYRMRATMQDNHYSAQKAKQLLGWEPCVSTRDGIRQAAQWYLNTVQNSTGRRSQR
jgi:nucleoside-diphosphate-sugar epimerase